MAIEHVRGLTLEKAIAHARRTSFKANRSQPPGFDGRYGTPVKYTLDKVYSEGEVHRAIAAANAQLKSTILVYVEPQDDDSDEVVIIRKNKRAEPKGKAAKKAQR